MSNNFMFVQNKQLIRNFRRNYGGGRATKVFGLLVTFYRYLGALSLPMNTCLVELTFKYAKYYAIQRGLSYKQVKAMVKDVTCKINLQKSPTAHLS